MKPAMQELIDYVNEIWPNGGWQECIKDKANELIEKEIQLQVDLIRFVRLNDKMGKSIVDLLNEFYNKNK